MLDTLIRGAKIVDGTGKAAFTADVGILDGMFLFYLNKFFYSYICL